MRVAIFYISHIKVIFTAITTVSILIEIFQPEKDHCGQCKRKIQKMNIAKAPHLKIINME